MDWLRARGWAAERTHYLPNFAADFFGAAPAACPGRPLLLGLGRLHADKGFDVLIDAAAMLPGVRLAIAGDGPEQARLRRQAARAGQTKFLGWRTDIAALLAAADVFVCSSRVEPLGNMVIEAWGAGRPVVACAADGPRELIRDGIDGLLVARENPAALAAAIRRVLDDAPLRAALGAAGRHRFETEFSRATVVARWRGFLRDYAAAGASRVAR